MSEKDARLETGAPTLSVFGAEEMAPTPVQLYGALAIGVFLGVALLAVLFERGQWPEVKPLVPLAAGIWSLGDIITASTALSKNVRLWRRRNVRRVDAV